MYNNVITIKSDKNVYNDCLELSKNINTSYVNYIYCYNDSRGYIDGSYNIFTKTITIYNTKNDIFTKEVFEEEYCHAKQDYYINDIIILYYNTFTYFDNPLEKSAQNGCDLP